MDELMRSLGTALGTVGPVGVVAIAYFALQAWTKKRAETVQFVTSTGANGTVRVPTSDSAVAPAQALAWHQENRDMIRDTNARTHEMHDMQEKELELLRDIVVHQERIAATLASSLQHLESLQETHALTTLRPVIPAPRRPRRR